MAARRSDSRLLRLVNSQRIVDELFASASTPTSRAGLSRSTGLSKPTVSAVVLDMEQAGLVRPAPMPALAAGARGLGRPADYFLIDPTAGLVVGVDIGATNVVVAAADLHGGVVFERRYDTPSNGRAVVDFLVVEILRILSGPLGRNAVVKRVGIGVPGVYDAETDTVALAWNLGEFDQVKIRTDLGNALEVAIDIDNDVNMAARAEAWLGHGAEVEDFVAVSIGSGIGMGVVLGGELHRGPGGKAGEIGHIEVPITVGDSVELHQLEAVASATAITGRYRQLSSDRAGIALDVAAIIEQVDNDEIARRVVGDAAEAIARMIVSTFAVLEPESVVLGGGVGSNPDFVAEVAKRVAQLGVDPQVVAGSTLGQRAGVLGAVDTATQGIRASLVEQLLYP